MYWSQAPKEIRKKYAQTPFLSPTKISDEKEKEKKRIMHLFDEAPSWSLHSARFSGHKYYENGDINFSMYYVTLRFSHNQTIMWL